jgi:beta-acetyl hexosaminidase like
LSSISISVASADETLQLGVNENYTLTVSTSGAQISAVTVFGALRGYELNRKKSMKGLMKLKECS